MMVEEILLEKVKALPINRQQEVLDFAEFLALKEAQPQPRRSLKGALSHLHIRVTEEDIRAARNEMWRGYTEDTE